MSVDTSDTTIISFPKTEGHRLNTTNASSKNWFAKVYISLYIY